MLYTAFALCSCKQLFESDRDSNGGASICLTLPATKRGLDAEVHEHAELMTQFYEVTFARAGMTDIVVRGNPGETVSSGELLEGVYAVEVYAYSYEGKKIGYGNQKDVRVLDGETTFITIGISEIKEPAISEDEDRPPIGTKARTEPKEVGDIVFNDGTAMPYADYDALDEEGKNAVKPYAIALIFYKGTELNNTGDSTTVRTLGVGLKQSDGYIAWCTASANAYSMTISTIYEHGTTDPNKNQSKCLEKIGLFLAQNESTDDTGIEANYPAFYFVKNYKRQKLSGESTSRVAGTAYENGWYLPGYSEFMRLYENGSSESGDMIFDVSAASVALGGDSFRMDSATECYLLATECGVTNKYESVGFGGFYKGQIWTADRTEGNIVCVIREF